MPRITVAERKRQETEAHDRAVFAALAWPKEPCPQPWSQQKMNDLLGEVLQAPVPAWTFNVFAKQVTYGSFDTYAHSTDSNKPRSQGQGGPWFASEADARLALRWAVCRAYAEDLLKLASA